MGDAGASILSPSVRGIEYAVRYTAVAAGIVQDWRTAMECLPVTQKWPLVSQTRQGLGG